jgi:hypothetical protein
VSSDFERFLREAREGLPGPDPRVTNEARIRSVLAVRPRRRRLRTAALLAAALVVTAALGVGVGTLIAPSGTAARGPVGLGFLPEPGWYALQSSARATATSPANAMASNVPFHPDDDVQGSAESSALPYSTLLSLPPHGVVITTTFTLSEGQLYLAAAYPPTKLPLKVSDAAPENLFGEQVRPEEPLGHQSLRASVNGHNVDLHVYFGTPNPPRSLVREAQRQLDRLVVRGANANPGADQAPRAPAPARTLSSANAVTVDRTLLCTTRTHGGIHEVEARAHEGFRVDGRWAKLAYATLTSGGAGGALSGNQNVSPNALAWMTAGMANAETTVDSEFWTFPVRTGGTFGYHRSHCSPTKTSVALTREGLEGGATGPLGEERDCATPTRILLRMRARFVSRGALQKRGDFVSTKVPILDAKLSMRTPAGKPLLYAEVFQSGKTRLYGARGCVLD